jgi:hypothetical protein
MYVMHYLAENVSCNVNKKKITGHKVSEVSEVHCLQRSFSEPNPLQGFEI